MTKHSQANLIKFLDTKVIQKSEAATLISKCRKALGLKRYQTSCAVIVQLSIQVSKTNSHRDFWGDSDTIAAIIRDGKVITVMLTRSDQCTKDHFRTDEIFS